jgi:hypothetical protein
MHHTRLTIDIDSNGVATVAMSRPPVNAVDLVMYGEPRGFDVAASAEGSRFRRRDSPAQARGHEQDVLTLIVIREVGVLPAQVGKGDIDHLVLRRAGERRTARAPQDVLVVRIGGCHVRLDVQVRTFPVWTTPLLRPHPSP